MASSPCGMAASRRGDIGQGWDPSRTREPPLARARSPPGSPETERRAPLLCRVSPLYLCLVIHL